MKYSVYLLASALTVVGCSTSPVIAPSKTNVATEPVLPRLHNQAEAYVPLRTLSVEDARALVAGGGFASAAKIAESRPLPRTDIAALQLEVVTEDGVVRSAMHFTTLPLGLRYVSHRVPATPEATELNESFIDVYGLASVLYWNSRFIEGNIPMRAIPDKVRLIKGHLFSTASGYVLEQYLPNDDVRTIACTPVESLPASKIHPDMTGLATTLSCDMSPGSVVARLWYFSDAALYVMSEIKVDGHLQSRFKITGVTFR